MREDRTAGVYVALQVGVALTEALDTQDRTVAESAAERAHQLVQLWGFDDMSCGHGAVLLLSKNDEQARKCICSCHL